MSELYLKDKLVLTLSDVDGLPQKVQKIDNPELLPVCLKEQCNDETFGKWLQKRMLPDKREGLDRIIQVFGNKWIEYKNFASLSDSYWIKRRTEQWKRVNFFTNIYSKDIGDIFFMPWTINRKKFSSSTPDLSTSGLLRKRWKQKEDKTSYLIKSGSVALHQEPLSEVLVSVMIEQIGKIETAGYDLHIEGTTMCSVCDNFVTENIELVTADQIYFNFPKKENDNVYTHLIKACEKYRIPGAEEFLKWLIFIDKITGNGDRTLGNIGFLRNIETMEFVGPAPVYDCGNAYWSTKQLNSAIKSNLFGAVENNIFASLKKEVNLEGVLKDNEYKKIIRAYPCITDTKKENLIEAISRRNNKILMKDELLR